MKAASYLAMKRGNAVKAHLILSFLALFAVSFSPQPGTEAAALQATGSQPVAATERNIALGLNHFDAHCAACHGRGGKADTARGKAVGAADLTSTGVQSKSDDELFQTISKGIPGTAMPAFHKSHSPTEIRQLILFLRKLPTLTAEERLKLEAAVPPEARHKHDSHQHDHTDKEHQHDKADAPGQKKTEPPTKDTSPDGHRHETERQPAERHDATAHSAAKGDKHARHEGGDTHGAHDMSAMMSTITGGPFRSMHAIGSGTSLLPASSPGYMWHWSKGGWMIMAHGDLKVGFNHQGGPRGVNKAESQNWLMLMAEGNAGGGRLMLRGMFSAEPWTAPRGGFPQLFQTGEAFEGRPIIDAQHPHDLFMELAAAYTVPLSERASIHLYGGPVAEPAL
ncbi:MAG TPA: cytochrome c, partial [Blastocatellia bacterium]|nr:cytochrome c [Blastocatellia bacterium]